MDLPRNLFKRALAAGEAQLGLWNAIPGPIVAEALAGAGFDFVVIDTEHAVTDIPDTLAMMQAMAAYPVSALVRPASNDPVLIKRLLDLGAQTLVLPYVQDAGEAAAAVAAMRYAPRGIRGVAGMTRANRFGRVTGYARRAEEELCLVVQVETAAALARIEEIAAVEGVDGIFVGPADLAASMGHPGEPGHPAVIAAVEDAIRRIRAAGRAAGVLTLDPALSRRYIACGSNFTALGLDLALLVASARMLVSGFRAD